MTTATVSPRVQILVELSDLRDRMYRLNTMDEDASRIDDIITSNFYELNDADTNVFIALVGGKKY